MAEANDPVEAAYKARYGRPMDGLYLEDEVRESAFRAGYEAALREVREREALALEEAANFPWASAVTSGWIKHHLRNLAASKRAGMGGG